MTGKPFLRGLVVSREMHQLRSFASTVEYADGTRFGAFHCGFRRSRPCIPI